MMSVGSILVTGARGYLGGRLVADLSADPALTVLGTTRDESVRRPSGWPQRADLVHLDPVRQTEALIVERLRGIDVIVHLAAANELVSARDPEEALNSGSLATLRLLKAAQVAGCRRFIFLSTIHVYGSPLRGRIVETDLPKPVHPYSITHRSGEDWVLAAHAKKEIEGVVLRLSNGIGAPAWMEVDRWSLIGNDLCRQAVTDGVVTLKSSGMQWRDFILLRDFVQAVRLVAELPSSQLEDGLFNLGGRLPLRMIDVAQAVARRATALLGRQITVSAPVPVPGEAGEAIDYDIGKIAGKGFVPSPAHVLDDEIDRTLQLCQAASAAGLA